MAEDAAATKLAVLIVELRADRRAIDEHAATVELALAAAPWTTGSPTLAVVAVAMHHFYGAAESVFERVGRAFEGLPDRSDHWHRDLLERMALAIDGVRPAVVRSETARALAPVLGFRHFFRHAYAVPFDPRRLQLAAEDTARAHALLAEDLETFDGVLRAAKGT